MSGGGPATSWFGALGYWYVRSGNTEVLGWLRTIQPEAVAEAPERGDDVPGIPINVQHLPANAATTDDTGVRPARRSDTRRCLSLINRIHRGQDFFRPYSAEFLQERLDDPGWGPKPVFWDEVYNWNDFFVLEDGGQIVACGGLWDKARHVRERNTSTGDEHIVAHRLSTIRNVDRIYVMADGQIAEVGKHDQLIAARGPYFQLYSSQFTEEEEVVGAERRPAGD